MSEAAEKIMKFPEKNRLRPETASVFAPLADDQAPGWLGDLRAQGLAQVRRAGLPTPRLERWKYTDIVPSVRSFGAVLGGADVAFRDPEGVVQKLADIYETAPAWLVALFAAAPRAEARYGDMPLWHLCNAYLRDGLMIDLPAGQVCRAPVEITITGRDGTFFVPRTAFRLGAGSALTVIEYHRGDGHFWNNRLTQIEIGANARLRHYRIQEYGAQAVYTQNTEVKIGRDGTYEGFTLTVGAGISRNQIHALLAGENATCNLFGINMLRGGQHADTTAEAEHLAPHGTSRQFVRSIVADQAHGVFQGKVYVHRGADKTDATQLSNALLLAEGAEMDTKPELEIYADDVKCGHGATTGRLEDEPLFYLRSRGLPEPQARRLLIEAFLGEIVDNLGDETVQAIVRERIEKWLS